MIDCVALRDLDCVLTMEVKVKTFQGAVYPLSLPQGGSTLVRDFKALAEGASGISVDEMKLLFHGRVLQDDHTLTDHGVEDGCTVLLMKKPPAPAQPQPAAQPQTQQQAPQQHQQPQMPPLFPQAGPAADTLNSILQQAFQQAFRTGSGVNVNVQLNTASSGANQPAQGQQPAGQQSQGPQMQVRVMPITQDMQTLMRDAYAQVSGGSRPRTDAPFGGQQGENQQPQAPPQSQPGQPTQQQPQQPQQPAFGQPLDLLQQIFSSIAGARNAAERENGPLFDSPEERSASQVAGSFMSNIMRDLTRQVDQNPDGSVTDFLQNEIDGMRGHGNGFGSDRESEDEANGPAHETTLDRLTREVFSKMSLQELVSVASHSEAGYVKLITASREVLIKEIDAGENPPQEAIDAYSAKVVEELVSSFREESLPSEVRERIKNGANLPDTFGNVVREPLRDFCRLLCSPDEPTQILQRIVDWSHSSLVGIVDGIAAVLQGGVDDVEVILRYLIYTVCCTSIFFGVVVLFFVVFVFHCMFGWKQNGQNDIGRDMAFSVATLFSQGVMSRYHRFKADILESSRSASAPTSSPTAASSGSSHLDIPFDAAVLVCFSFCHILSLSLSLYVMCC